MLLGSPENYKGTATHFTHYHGLVNDQIRQGLDIPDSFFSKDSNQKFLLAGMICIALSIPASMKERCCELEELTCDGTGLGICVKTVLPVPEVWLPENPLKSHPVSWGRKSRCIIRLNSEFPSNQSELDAIQTLISELVIDAASNVSPCLDSVRSSLENKVASVYIEEICRWLGLPWGTECKMLKRLIKVFGTEDSITGVIPLELLCPLQTLLQLCQESKWEDVNRELDVQKDLFGRRGRGVNIWTVLAEQMRRHGQVHQSTEQFFSEMGELLFIFMHHMNIVYALYYCMIILFV